MRTFYSCLILFGLLIGTGHTVKAFSILGPFTSWQTATLNYDSPFTSISRQGDLGGPMNLGEEYRWGSPVVVYGFDSTFVEYFGQQGVAAVEAAIKILNDLPATTQMSANLSEFQSNTTRFNYTAQQLRLRDIKSLTLSIMLQNLGLACPERFAWTLRQQIPIPNTTPTQYYYMVVPRNFDPITHLPSPYVNNTLYTYQILKVSSAPDTWDCQELAVDVGNPNVSVIATAGLQAGVVDPRVTQQVYGNLSFVQAGFGLYYTGLTRDDVGAIRYMYSPSNINWQSAPAGSYGTAGTSPWANISYQIVNPNPISPWTVVGGPISGGSNSVAGVTGSGFLQNGGRGGANKLSYVRADVDPLLGQYLVPMTVSYPETVIDQSGTTIRQFTGRTITRPDILFTAEDIGTYPNTPEAYVYDVVGKTFNQVQVPTAQAAQDGPGTLEPGLQVILNKVGPWIFNVRDTSQEVGIKGFVWGSYDGTTNAPVVYPVGSSAQALARKQGYSEN